MKELKMFIDGRFIEHESGKWIKVLNPSTEEVISLMPDGTVEDAKRAIDAAEKAQGQWERTPSIERAAYLTKIAAGIRKREKELTDIIVREGGKTQGLANVEVLFTADYIDYMAGWARRYEGEIIPSDRPRESIFLFKKAIGVTTGILPWNFPFFLVARKAAPALITGNTIVVKPSQLTPENAYVFAQIVEEVGLPAGVFNLVNGRGSVIGHELAANPKVGMVSLTGSVSAGQQTMAAAAPNITKVSLELGGKAPAIVMEDADIDLAVKSIIASRVINTGQVCNCAGNTIVVKPSQLTPENAYVFAQIVEEVGLPAGVFNLVNGRGSVIGHELAANPKVGMVSLTGSVSAGQQTMAAAAPNITKVSLELGGKAPAIVMEDADIDLAVKSIIASRVINTGQVCNCAERVYVDKKIKDIFMEKLVAGMKQVKVGNPNEIADLDMGPLIEANALAAMEQKVEKAVRQGAKLLCGGHRIGTKGYFFEPTVLDCATQEMDIIREETFGPILPIVEYTDIDDAIAWANDCEYGLTSSVYTQNLDYAFKIMRSLKFGETYINRENFEAMQGFHAGWRKSGIGGADGKHGLEEYLQTHVVYIETKE